MMEWFKSEGLTSHDAPNVSAQENAGNPHYNPTREHSRTIGRDELVLIDLWGKLADPGAVFADITWVGFTGDAGTGQVCVSLCGDRGRTGRRHRAGRDGDAGRAGTSAGSRWTGPAGR